jgi:hypothetical protein
MKHRLLSSVLLSLAPLAAFANASSDTPLFSEQEPGDLVIYNRILAKVNGKTVSVVDVMKKMDLFLQKNYPQHAHSKLARFQFYSSEWRGFLTQIIDTELMLADASKLEVKVTEAEVREEILNRFGPNTMTVLDKLNFSYEEVRAMIHDEMLVQRMMWFRVNSKALSSVTTQDVREAYRQYREKNPEVEEWHYQVLSIRSPDKSASASLAARAFELLRANLTLDLVSSQLKSTDSQTTITLSPAMEADEKSISASHKEVLQTLAVNSFSQPIAQVSRVDNSVVYRIFHLKKHSRKTVPPFEKMAEEIKEHLLQAASNRENIQYIAKLRERLGYDEKQMMETLPDDFQPFALR